MKQPFCVFTRRFGHVLQSRSTFVICLQRTGLEPGRPWRRHMRRFAYSKFLQALMLKSILTMKRIY